jgi:diacylglycerol kinase (ATP)
MGKFILTWVHMSDLAMPSQRSIFVLLNPAAGQANVETIRQGMENLCQEHGWGCEVYETNGQEKLPEVVRSACESGANLVVAAGGDGTVWAACNGLVGSQIPLAILPAGTGNGLARALNVPLQIEAAIDLLAGDCEILEIDALRVGEQYFVLNVSTGISARTMQETLPENKQQAGILAYAATILRDLTDLQVNVFHLNLDGHDLRVRAVEVLVSNSKIGSKPPYLFGEREGYQDGLLEVNILTAEKTGEFINLAWELLLDPEASKSNLHELSVRRSLRLDVEGLPMTVQGDGEVIGETPVEIQVVPKAVRVLVPKI